MIVWKNAFTLAQITIGYGLLCVFLPSLCLHDLVEGRSLTYRFIFYQVSANVYLILWGFILAFLHIFNAPVLWLVLVVLPLLLTAWRRRAVVAQRWAEGKELAETILTGMYGGRVLVQDVIISVRSWLRRLYRKYIKGHIWELVGLSLIFAYILWAFGQYHLTHEAFAYGDENVHFYWEKELLHGNPFPVGMYPHGMHFLVASLSALFGLTLSRASIMIGTFNTCLLFCTLYLVLKDTFRSRVAILFGIGFFLITDIFDQSTYWRYQVALPMEMGLIPYCMIFYGLQHYVQSRDRRDLLIFILSVCWCISIHFYSAIFAAISCVAFGIAFLRPMLKKRILHWVVLGGLLGIVLSLAPFAVGYILGYPFQGSIDWAIGVIEEGAAVNATESSASLEVAGKAVSVLEQFMNKAFWTVEKTGARVLLLSLGGIMLVWGIAGAIRAKETQRRHPMILFWALSWLFCLIISTGIVPLMQTGRFSIFFSFSSIVLFIVPVQLLYNAAAAIKISPKRAEMALSAGTLVCFSIMALSGHCKDHFAVEMGMISEGDMKTCYRLMEEYPNESWTIVSTTYDLAFVRYYGFHYEIIELLSRLDGGNGPLHLPQNDDSIYVPTRDIFVVTETKIDQYNELDYFHNSHDDADALKNHGEPTAELALTPLPDDPKLLNSVRIYNYPWRGVVMSKLYYWMEKVKEAYPNEVSVFYQDDTVTVYHIRQDEYFPLDLKLDYQSDLQQ